MLLFELYKFFNDKIRCLIGLNVKSAKIDCQIYYIIKIVLTNSLIFRFLFYLYFVKMLSSTYIAGVIIILKLKLNHLMQ